MGITKLVLLLIGISSIFAYKTEQTKIVSTNLNQKEKTTNVAQSSKAELLLTKTINAHGGDLYKMANYSFIFRGDTYYFKNDNTNYEYSKIHKKEKQITQDFLKNGLFTRKVDNDTIKLTQRAIKGSTNSLNSVIYFATLPYKLNDKAVNKAYIGQTTIKGNNYEILRITFNKEGGGQDYEDQFHYWINTETNKIDYLAYNYKVNNGGVRFRAAYNRRVIDGITFQDYVNYKADYSTALIDLPKLYENGKLKELSKIETENVINLNNKKQ